MSETKLVAAILKALKSAGYWAWRTNSGRVFARGGVFHGAPLGTPDILVIKRPAAPQAYGYLVGLEVKTQDKASKQEDSQRDWQALAARNGVPYAVVRGAGEALKFLEGVK